MLRHVFGLLAGLACAPLLWLGSAWAASEVLDGVRTVEVGGEIAMPGVAALMVAGVLGALLAGSRLSPVAALISGTLLLGFHLWPLLDRASFDETMPGWLTGSMVDPLAAGFLVTVPLGTLLLISALMPSRWRSAGAAPPPPGHPPQPGLGARQQPYAPVGLPSEARAPDDTPDYGGSAATTTPFHRDPSGGSPRPAPTDPSATQVFSDGEGQ